MPSTTSGRRVLAALAMSAALVVSTLGATPAEAATPANRSYVQALYADILDRPDTGTDPSGIEFWANRLDSNPWATVVRQIMFAPNSEYFRFQVELAYNLYLERTADPSGFSYYTEQWRTGKRSMEDLVAILVGSNEFYRISGGTPDGFVNRVYFDILGRQPDAAGLAYYKNVAANRGRGSVARILLASNEALRKEVSYKYDNFLSRAPSASELAYWVAQRRDGRRFEVLDVTLVASGEYYAANSAG